MASSRDAAMHFYEKVYPGRLENWKIEKFEDWKIVLETTKEKSST
jgi:hypothetical protein